MKYGLDRLRDLLEAPLWNIAQSFYDQYVEANVRFRQNSGFRMIIIRRQVAKCCDWCAKLAGIYYADEAPDDIYRRHDNCRCMVTTTTEKGGYRDAWSKKEFKTQREARKARIAELEEKSIDIKRRKQYYNSPGQNDIQELKRIYEEDVKSGWISPLSGFDNYYRQYQRVMRSVVGLKTRDGIEVKSISRHFMQRVIGTGTDPKILKEELRISPRSGVDPKDIKDALLYGRIRKIEKRKTGEISSTYVNNKCAVTINPKTGTLVQCNPL